MSEDEEEVEGLTATLEEDFNKIGVTLYDSAGKMKSTYDIFVSLAEIWPTLSNETKQYYAELSAGKTQANVFLAIMDNMQTAIDATATAYDSAGSAAEENAKAMDSVKGKWQAVRAEFEALASSETLNSLIKGFLEISANVLKLVNAIGGLNAILPITLVVVGSIIKSTKLWTTVTTTLKVALTALKSTTGLVTLGLSALIGVVGAIATAISNAKQKIKEENEALLDNADANKKNFQVISQNIDRYKELINMTDRTTAENEELYSIEDKLIDALGTKAELLGLLTKGTNEYSEAVAKLSERELNELYAKTGETAVAARTELKGLVTPFWGYTGFGSGSIEGKYKDSAQRILETSNLGYYDTRTRSMKLRGIDSAQASYRKGEITETSEAVAEYDAVRNAMELLQTVYKETLDETIITSDAYKELKIRLEELEESTQKYIKAELNVLELSAMGDNAVIDSQEEYDKLVGSIEQSNEYSELEKKYLKELAAQSYPAYSKAIITASTSLEHNVEINKELVLDQNKLFDSLESLEGVYEALLEAQQEYEENGSLSVKTVSSLLSEYGDYIEYLIDENGNLSLNAQEINNMVEAKKQDLKATVMLNALNEIEKIQNKTKATEDNTKAIEENNEKIRDRFESLVALDTYEFGTDSEAISKILKNAQANLLLIDKMLVNSSSNGSSKSSDAWKDAFEKAYDELNHLRNMDEIGTEKYISELTKLNDNYYKNRTEYAEEYMKYVEEIYKEEKNLFKETIEYAEHQIDLMTNRGESKNAIIARYEDLQEAVHEKAEEYRKRGLEESSEEIQELQDMWWKYADEIADIQEEIKDNIQEKYENIRDAAIDAIEEQIDAEETALEERNNLIDEQIEKYEAEEEALESQSETEEKLLKIEQARAKLAAAKSQKVRVYRAGQGFVYESDFDAVSEAQSELDELLKDWDLFQEKAKIADIVAELEAEKEANEKRTEQTIADLNALKDAWDKSLDISADVSEYEDYLKSLENMEESSLDARLEMVKDFVQSYKEEMAEMQDVTTESLAEQVAQTSEATTNPDWYGQTYTAKTSNGVTYYKEIDYQAAINDAVANGAPEDEIARLEKARNAKIEGEGLSETKTYNYTGKSTSSSSSKSSKSLYSAVKSAVSSIGSVIKKVTGLASGTESSDGMLHLVGENGPEFYVPPKGAGIIPNDLTSNLMALGSMNPAELLSSATSNTSIEIGSISLPGVTDANSFVKELENFKTLAVQKSSLRR